MITLEIPPGLPSIATRHPFDWRLYPNAANEITRLVRDQVRADDAIRSARAELAARYASRGALRGSEATSTALAVLLGVA